MSQGDEMDEYDPENAPDPETWLELDDSERIQLVVEQHVEADDECPNLEVHAIIHAIVENQIAMGLESTTETMERLQREGLTRHDALHAVGSVVAEHMFEILRTGGKSLAGSVQPAIDAALRRLDAARWRASGESS
jgi:hypothetical protein